MLEGIRILDLSRLLPGPLCTQHLAFLGADVVKVEDARQGDYARSLPPFQGRNSYLFNLVNRDKRSVTLDLKTPAGAEAFRRMAARADVVVETFRPGVADAMGIGYERLRAENPGLVYCAISGYGQTGPRARQAGHDMNFTALTGVLDQNGRRGGPPVLGNFQLGDLLGGALNGCTAVLAALLHRERTGEGQFVDVAMADSVAAHAVVALATMQANGGKPMPRGGDLLSGGMPFYDLYETADGRWMALGAVELKFWQAACTALGLPDLAAKHIVFGEEAENVRAKVAAAFGSRTQAEWTAVFEPLDCCVTPVRSLDECAADPHFQARGLFEEYDHPTEGRIRQFGLPMQFSAWKPAHRHPAPAQGQHTAQVLREYGFSAEEAAALGG